MSEGHSVTVRHVDVADDQNNIVSKFLCPASAGNGKSAQPLR